MPSTPKRGRPPSHPDRRESILDAALEAFVERIPLEAPEGEPLKLELENFVAALCGDGNVAVTGQEGRDALAVALRIVGDIERALPGVAALRSGAGKGA